MIEDATTEGTITGNTPSPERTKKQNTIESVKSVKRVFTMTTSTPDEVGGLRGLIFRHRRNKDSH